MVFSFIVGLKLNFVDPTMSIDLKYLGVQLPLSYSNDCPLWKTLGTNSCSAGKATSFSAGVVAEVVNFWKMFEAVGFWESKFYFTKGF